MKIVVIFFCFVSLCSPAAADGSCDISDDEIRRRFDSIDEQTKKIVSLLEQPSGSLLLLLFYFERNEQFLLKQTHILSFF